MSKHKKNISDGRRVLDQLIGNNPAIRRMIQEERAKLDVAQKIHDLREKAGLTQSELAMKIGSTQSVISQLEDAAYSGHSLSMLTRIAAALDQRVEIRFVPDRRRQIA